MISVNGLSGFIGIDCYNANNYPTNTCEYFSSELKRWLLEKIKNIELKDAERIQARATDSKQAILNIAYANFRHGWNGTIKANEIKTAVKTLADIRGNLSLTDGHNAPDQ